MTDPAPRAADPGTGRTETGEGALPAVRPPFDRPARTATRLSLAVVAVVLVVELAVPGGWGSAAWVPLVAGLLLGLPHGAVDHLVPAARLGWRLPRLALFATGYAALAAAAYGLFRTFPGPALAAFVLLSVWHFGSGETAFADLRAGRPVRLRVGAALVLGGVVLLLPLARGWSEAGGEVPRLVTAVAPGWALPGGLADAVRAGVVAAAVVLGALRVAQRRWLEAAESAALLALGLLVPPLAAFGVYFGAWHGLRHTARVVAEDPANAPSLSAGRLGPPLRRFARTAAAPTIAVLLVLALLWQSAGGWRAFVVAYVPLLAALTVPHVLVVGWLDRTASAHTARRPGATEAVRSAGPGATGRTPRRQDPRRRRRLPTAARSPGGG